MPGFESTEQNLYGTRTKPVNQLEPKLGLEPGPIYELEPKLGSNPLFCGPKLPGNRRIRYPFGILPRMQLVSLGNGEALNLHQCWGSC